MLNDGAIEVEGMLIKWGPMSVEEEGWKACDERETFLYDRQRGL